MQNKEQFEMLFRSHYEQMLKLARFLLKDDEEAEDVVSDIFTEVWEGSINLCVEKSKNYLLMCVRNRCLDLLEHQKIKERVHRLLTLDTSPVMPDMDDYQLELDRIREMVDTRLYAEDKQILLMKYERKKKYKEIAEELDISEAAVYKHLSHALKILKDNLKTNENEDR
jgi:RNA polymerase sigma-70 factor (family 1)